MRFAPLINQAKDKSEAKHSSKSAPSISPVPLNPASTMNSELANSSMENCLYEGDYPYSLPVQAKLQVGQANDRYEQEADQVAESIVGNTNSQSVTPINSMSTPLIQRQPEDEEPPFPEEEEEPEEGEEEEEEETTAE